MGAQFSEIIKVSAVILSDDTDLISVSKEVLRAKGVSSICTSLPTSAMDVINKNPDTRILILDSGAKRVANTEYCNDLSRACREKPVSAIIIAGAATVDVAVSAIRFGATDFLRRPINNDQFSAAIDLALERAREIRSVSAFFEDADEQVRILVEMRNDRRLLFPDVPGGETAWDLLLDIAVAHSLCRVVSISALCAAANLSPSGTLKRIAVLESEGLAERTVGQNRRNAVVQITPKGAALVRGVGERLAAKLRSLL